MFPACMEMSFKSQTGFTFQSQGSEDKKKEKNGKKGGKKRITNRLRSHSTELHWIRCCQETAATEIEFDAVAWISGSEYAMFALATFARIS